MSRPSLPLQIEALTVQYPNGTVAVNRLCLTVAPGEVFGLVGPNGAGKSSLLNCAAGLIRPRTGRVLCGERAVTGDACSSARFITLMPDPLGVYNDLSATEYLEFFARALGVPASRRASIVSDVIERLGLRDWLEHEVEALSAGWQRRLALARVLLADSPIVLLDEPAAGLDVAARAGLLKIVRGFAGEGRTVVVTSHILPELEQLADRFGIIERGAWLPVDGERIFFTQADLARGFGRAAWRLECSDGARAAALLGRQRAEPLAEANALRVLAADREAAAAALAELVANGIRVYAFYPQASNLAEVTLNALGYKS